MQKNIGALDRLIRFIAGAVLAILVIASAVTGTAAVVLGIIAILLLLTSIISFCPLYVPFKISTLKKTPEK